MRFLKFFNKSANKKTYTSKNANDNLELTYISTNLNENINRIKSEFGNSTDLAIRELTSSYSTHFKLAVLFFAGLVDISKLNILSMELTKLVNSEKVSTVYFDSLKGSLLSSSIAIEGSDYNTLYTQLLSGNTAILVEGNGRFIILNTYGPEGRSVEEPTSQTIIRGPKEGFTEKILINVSLIRRKIKSKSLRVETLTIGNMTKTNVAIMYIEQIAKKEIIKELTGRLNQIKIDGILDSGYIEELIKDDPYSVFPTFLNSERPDSVAAALLEGKIAILVDGSPYVLTAPAFFPEFFQVSEDYYNNYVTSSLMRFLRHAAFYLSLLVPSIYIALITFHQEMIPTALLVSIAAQREGVPFPAFFEALLMEVAFEILREAGIRMPRAIGSAISIVGALVLGQAAVAAGIISAVMVIIVSITAISSFAAPSYSMINVVRVVKFVFMVLAATFGLYGIFMGLITLVLHLCKLKSIGIPYLTPVAPRIKGENKDTFYRAPLWKMRYRPSSTAKSDVPRLKMKGPIKKAKKNG